MSTCYGLKAENIEDDLRRHVDMGTSRWTCYPLVICWNMSHNFQAPTSQNAAPAFCNGWSSQTKLSLPAISINFIRTTDPGGRHRISTHLPRMPKSVTCPVGCDHSNPQISAVFLAMRCFTEHRFEAYTTLSAHTHVWSGETLESWPVSQDLDWMRHRPTKASIVYSIIFSCSQGLWSWYRAIQNSRWHHPVTSVVNSSRGWSRTCKVVHCHPRLGPASMKASWDWCCIPLWMHSQPTAATLWTWPFLVYSR